PIEGADEKDTRALGHAARWIAVWWALCFYLPLPSALLGGLIDHALYGWRGDAEVALIFAVGAGILALVKLAIWVVRFRRCAASRAVPIARKLVTVLPAAFVLAAISLPSLVAATETWPEALDEATAVVSILMMVTAAPLVVGAISAAVASVLRRLTRGELCVVALTRSLAAAAPALAVILLVAALMTARRRAMPMSQIADSGEPSEESEGDRSWSFRGRSGLEKTAVRRPSRKAGAPGREGRQALKAPTRIRRYFPETLLWKPELITDERGRARLEVPLADSITTWRIAMSAVSARGELGSGTKGLRVFQDFFVDIDFPVALTQHDRVSVPVAVYNYLDRPQTVRLEIEPRAWFRLEGDRSRELRIGAKEVTSVYLTMEALRPGSHSLLVKAYGTEMADAVERRVRVEPDGKPFVRTINGRLGENLTREFTIPERAIDGASDLIVKIYPGSFSQVLEGLDSIFRMPYGCFEQTSSVTYPNILVLDYMRRTKQIKPEIEMKALNFINLGYQRLLSFEVAGGGFDWYGKAPANTVLTAYGLMEFSDMAEVYEIDPAVINRTREWLDSKQEGDGSWAPTHMRAVRGAGDAKQARLRTTAYVAWAISESVAAGTSKVHLARALDYVAGGIEGENDPYTLAVAANALVAAGRSEAKRALTKLDGLKKVDGKLIHWSSKGQGVTYSRGNVLDVETTALAAYTYLKASHRTGDAHKALAWLVEKKDPRGTWWSTQATVHAMRALLTGSGPSGAAEGELDVTISANGKLAKELVITPETSDVFRLVSLRELVREGPNDVSLEAAGKGELAYQIVATHYMPWAREAVEGAPARKARKEITIDVKYDTTRLKKDDTLTSRVTIRYNRPEPANMTIIDLGIPPGFEVIPDLF
ncbi:MAG: alpha-2-macroglobulin family protein, partial [Planctomycetota bacterium]